MRKRRYLAGREQTAGNQRHLRHGRKRLGMGPRSERLLSEVESAQPQRIILGRPRDSRWVLVQRRVRPSRDDSEQRRFLAPERLPRVPVRDVPLRIDSCGIIARDVPKLCESPVLLGFCGDFHFQISGKYAKFYFNGITVAMHWKHG